MFRNCVRVALVALVAVVSASAGDTNLSGHPIEYDMIVKDTQADINALGPVVKALKMPNVTSSYNAWVDKFQKAAKAGTMTRQQNADNLKAFRSSASKQAPSFAADATAALSKATISFLDFDTFMPAATYDLFEYGVLHLKDFKFNTSTITPIRTYMTKNIDTANVADLQSKLDAYVATSEKASPGFKSAVVKTLNALYKSVQGTNSTVAPTTTPSMKTPVPSTKTPVPSTKTPVPATTTPAPSATTVAPTAATDLGESQPATAIETKTTTTVPTTAAPTPAPTPKSSALVVSANVALTVVALVFGSALM